MRSLNIYTFLSDFFKFRFPHSTINFLINSLLKNIYPGFNIDGAVVVSHYPAIIDNVIILVPDFNFSHIYICEHFRKECKTCKCGRDSHEIVVENSARSRLGMTTINDGLEPRNLGYAFVPPGLVTAKQVCDFWFCSCIQSFHWENIIRVYFNLRCYGNKINLMIDYM